MDKKDTIEFIDYVIELIESELYDTAIQELEFFKGEQNDKGNAKECDGCNNRCDGCVDPDDPDWIWSAK